MFRTMRMQRFLAIFPKRLHGEVIATLHEQGIVQFKEVAEPEIGRMTVSEEIYKLSSLLNRLKEIQEFVGPSHKVVEIEEETSAATIARAEKLLKAIETKFNSLRDIEIKLNDKKIELITKMEVLKKFVEIESPLSYLKTTDEIRTLAGSVAAERVNEFANEISASLDYKVFITFFGKGKKKNFITVCRTKDQQKLLPILYRFGVE
ncbi:MAG: hypothetical protein QXN56_07005, partial [Candidatus Hadarchaeum sp.]